MSASWIFGYGSLVWRPAFPYAEARPARLRGWRRVFWQGSTDHRGMPGAPGRVVTLVGDPAAECGGVAYRLDEREAAEILAALDHRERGGYERRVEELVLDDGGDAPGLVYLATPRNPNYLGPAPLDEIAAQIRRSHGPSGANVEYVLRLAGALRRLGFDDPHVFELERALARR